MDPSAIILNVLEPAIENTLLSVTHPCTPLRVILFVCLLACMLSFVYFEGGGGGWVSFVLDIHIRMDTECIWIV